MILISVGHHPHSKGASFGDFTEFEEAQQWASILCNMLGVLAMQVPVGVLRSKVAFINNYCSANPGNNVAIEIHFNMAWIDKNKDKVVDNDEFVGRGSETLYYPGSIKGKHIAEEIQGNLSRVFGPSRGVKEGWYRMKKENGPDYFLARTTCPSIIVEPEFVHNHEKIIEGRVAGCSAIAQVLIDLYGGE